MRDFILDEWRNSPDTYIRPIQYTRFELFIIWVIMGAIGGTGAFALVTVVEAWISFGGV